MDICHLKNAELEAKHRKYKSRDVLRGNIVKDDSVGLCSIHWTRIFSISNDSRQDQGYHLQIATVRWTSSRRSIRLYPSKNGRCSRPDKKSWSWVETRTYWTSIIERTTFGLRLSRHEAAEVGVNLTEELRHAETDPMCEIHERPLHVIPKFEDQNPSLGYICPGEPHQRSPNAPKFKDRSQEETEWQEQGPREAAWKLAKSVLKLKEHQRAAFFSPSEYRCLPVSTLKPEEREYSGALVHMISKKDLSDAEMDTFTKSCSPTIVITANGEVQTHEEATVYVK